MYPAPRRVCISFTLVPVVDLSAQALDVHLDEVRHRIEAVVPDVLGDVGAADDFALPPHKVLEQRVFLRGELNGAPAALDAARARIDGEILDRQDRGRERGPAAEQRADPREQLGKVVRLGQVVVGAGIEALDALVRFPARGQHQDGRRDAFRAQLAAHVEPVDAGQEDVEDDEVVVVDAACSRASMPSAATSTAYACSRSPFASTAAAAGSSSTTKILIRLSQRIAGVAGWSRFAGILKPVQSTPAPCGSLCLSRRRLWR